MIYVLSDVHGNRKNFENILKKINLQPEDSLYILGDVIDRYPDGIRLLQKIRGMQNAHMLLGNHEWMMMNALKISYRGTAAPDSRKIARKPRLEQLRLWYMNNGEVTHSAWKKLPRKEQKELGTFLSELPLGYKVEAGGRKFRLVHAAPVEMYNQLLFPQYENAVDFAVWDRTMFRIQRENAEDTIIFGHTPTLYMQKNNPLEIWNGGGMIGIDCGSGFPDDTAVIWGKGRLACLRLDDMQVFYSE